MRVLKNTILNSTLLVLTTGGGAYGQPNVTFTSIADSNTAIPGGEGTFLGFFASASGGSDGTVAFWGFGSSEQGGLYTGNGGAVTKVVDLNTPIPGGEGNFELFAGFPSIDGPDVVFTSTGPMGAPPWSVYKMSGNGPIEVVADENTPAPGGAENFMGALMPRTSGGDVAFTGILSGVRWGIYVEANGEISTVADTDTVRPGGSQKFAILGYPDISGANIVFGGAWWTGQDFGEGVYSNVGGDLNIVADIGTDIPGGNGTFGGFVFNDIFGLSISGDDVAFRGWGPGQMGIYTHIAGTLGVVADLNTPVPDGSGDFTGLYWYSISNGDVAFAGEDANGQVGIYINFEGEFFRVIDEEDILDGKAISELGLLSSEALSGNLLSFEAQFQDGSSAVYRAEIETGDPCPADLNNDGIVDLADLGILLADFGCTPPGPCLGDINGDGATDLADLGILLANFGSTCP